MGKRECNLPWSNAYYKKTGVIFNELFDIDELERSFDGNGISNDNW